MSSSSYQSEFNHWTNIGYRLTQVHGYSDHGNDCYAAVWVKQPGPAYIARHGLSSSSYQQEVDEWTKKGFRLTQVNGFASGKGVKYTAILEKRTGPPYVARHDMTSSDYEKECDKWANQGFRLTHVSGFSQNRGPRFAAIWEKKRGPNYVARHDLSSSSYQKEYDNWTAKGYRLVHVSGYEHNGAERYAAIWQQSKGRPSMARHGLTAMNYQSEFDNAAYTGYMPTVISPFSVGSSACFAAIWENHAFSAADLTALDTIIRTFMQKYNVPGLGVAISKDERLVFAKGYGLSDKSKRWVTSPTHLFRVASVSKPITSVAVMKLVEDGRIKLTDKVFGRGAILGKIYGTKPYSPNVEHISVQHLLEHTAGGWGNSKNDPMFSKPSLNHGQLISWVLDDVPLEHDPGSTYSYSNFGYCLLGRIIEQRTGIPYFQYVRDKILKPMGIQDMHIAGDSKSARRPNEVIYYGQNGQNPYGMKVARMDAHGGWIASPIDLVRFLVHVDRFPKKKDVLKRTTIDTMTTPSDQNSGYAKGWFVNSSNNWWHGGLFNGSQAEIVRASHGFNWAVVLNTRSTKEEVTKDLDGLIWEVLRTVKHWPSHDLF
jgi:CubicO group peptidase (beta-lactamase class C family)